MTGRALLALACAFLAACATGDVAPERLPRFEALAHRPRVALVLGSGGPRGFAHVGVLKVLEEQGVRPDIIVGSSVGALVGVLYAGGYSAAQLEKLARDVSVLELFEFGILRGSLASGVAIQNYVDARLGHRAIEDLPIPFVAVATREADHGIALFNRGDPGLAVRASGASPGQFKPVRIGSETYLDGDEVSPVPIRIARKLGAEVVIAVDVSAYLEGTPPDVPLEWRVKDERRAAQIRAEAKEADVLLHPDIGYFAGYDGKYRRRSIALAESYTRGQLPRLQAAFARAGVALPVLQAMPQARIPSGEASR